MSNKISIFDNYRAITNSEDTNYLEISNWDLSKAIELYFGETTSPISDGEKQKSKIKRKSAESSGIKFHFFSDSSNKKISPNRLSEDNFECISIEIRNSPTTKSCERFTFDVSTSPTNIISRYI